MLLVSLLAALVPVFLVFTVRWWMGRAGLQPLWIYPLLVLAGGIGGLLFGLFGGPLLAPWFGTLVADEGSELVLTIVVGPLAEEIGKALILLLVVLTPWYRSAADGLLFGLAAGAGFATLENVLWFSVAHQQGGEAAWVAALSVRLLPSTLIHGGTTALVGAYLGAVRWERRPLVVFATLPSALLIATLIHGGWNGLMELAAHETGTTHALLALAVLPVLTISLLYLMRACHRLEKREVQTELAPIVRAGLLAPDDLSNLTNRFTRRGWAPWVRFARDAYGLAFALRGQRLEQRGRRRLDRFRRAVLARHHAAGRVTLTT